MAKGKQEKVLIGEQLIKEGIITPEQLEFALKEQSKLKGKYKERLCEVIMRCGLADESLITHFLEKYLKIPYMPLKNKAHVDPKAIQAVPERMARNFKIICIKLEDSKLHLAMANPFDVIAIDTIREKTGREIQRWFSHSQEIERAIEKFYKEVDFDKSINEFISSKEKEQEEEKKSKTTFINKEHRKLEEEAVKVPVVEFVEKLLENSIRKKASDIHIEPRENELFIRHRVDGILSEVTPPPKAMQSAIITRVKLLGGMDIAEHRLPQDGRFKYEKENKSIDIRLASTPTIFGEKIVLRLLDKTELMLDMEKLGIEPEDIRQLKHIVKQPYGMVLVSGPTGSGKTTTLYSALKYVNEPGKNIVTIEDPVEYQLKGINQIQIKPVIGLTFASSLRTILRQDPDIIMIGEIRDLETLENAVKASLTGHLVLSTIHTNDAPSVIYRLIHMGLEPYLITACLNLVVAQRLVRKICENCKEKINLQEPVLKGLEKRLSLDLKKVSFYKGKGCHKCNDTGYSGRVGLYEFFVVNDEIKELILEGVGEHELKKAAVRMGLKDLLHRGIEKINQGLTTMEEVLKVSFVGFTDGPSEE